MSSHHIVRDEQEPALFLHSIKPHQWESVLQLLEWSPTVIACEGVLEKILVYGHKVDIALVDERRMKYWAGQLDHQSPIEIIEIEKNNFFDIGLNRIKQNNHRAVNVITDNASFLFVLTRLSANLKDFDIVIFSEDQKHAMIKSMIYKKWLPAFSSLSILPLKASSLASTEGFDLNLDNELLNEGILLDKKIEGEVKIKFSKVPFVVSERL